MPVDERTTHRTAADIDKVKANLAVSPPPDLTLEKVGGYALEQE